MSKTILYITPIKCPENSAAFNRILHNCLAFKKAGYSPMILGSGLISNPDQHITFEGIEICTVEPDLGLSNNFFWQSLEVYESRSLFCSVDEK